MAAPQPGPLILLGARLLGAGPPRLSDVVEWIDATGAFVAFVTLVREYLPDQEQAILHEQGASARVAAFANQFRDRHFPLPDFFEDGVMGDVGYGDLVRCIPLQGRGIGWEGYHDLTSWRDDLQVLAVMSENPHMFDHEDGGRVALLESCAHLVPERLLARTGRGYPRELLHEQLDGTRYEPAALMADWLHGDTGNAWLDLDPDADAEIVEMWQRETVDYLTDQWHEADLIEQRIRELGEWIMKEPGPRFSRMLNVIEGHEELNPPDDPRQMRLPGPDFQPVESR